MEEASMIEEVEQAVSARSDYRSLADAFMAQQSEQELVRFSTYAQNSHERINAVIRVAAKKALRR